MFVSPVCDHLPKHAILVPGIADNKTRQLFVIKIKAHEWSTSTGACVIARWGQQLPFDLFIRCVKAPVLKSWSCVLRCAQAQVSFLHEPPFKDCVLIVLIYNDLIPYEKTIYDSMDVSCFGGFYYSYMHRTGLKSARKNTYRDCARCSITTIGQWF